MDSTLMLSLRDYSFLMAVAWGLVECPAQLSVLFSWLQGGGSRVELQDWPFVPCLALCLWATQGLRTWLWKASKFVPSRLIYFVEVKLELMALMVYNAPKWFLALRQALLALRAGFQVWTISFLGYIFLLKSLLSGQLICASEVKR
jgi:hypothetical protein